MDCVSENNSSNVEILSLKSIQMCWMREEEEEDKKNMVACKKCHVLVELGSLVSAQFFFLLFFLFTLHSFCSIVYRVSLMYYYWISDNSTSARDGHYRNRAVCSSESCYTVAVITTHWTDETFPMAAIIELAEEVHHIITHTRERTLARSFALSRFGHGPKKNQTKRHLHREHFGDYKRMMESGHTKRRIFIRKQLNFLFFFLSWFNEFGSFVERPQQRMKWNGSLEWKSHMLKFVCLRTSRECVRERRACYVLVIFFLASFRVADR